MSWWKRLFGIKDEVAVTPVATTQKDQAQKAVASVSAAPVGAKKTRVANPKVVKTADAAKPKDKKVAAPAEKKPRATKKTKGPAQA